MKIPPPPKTKDKPCKVKHPPDGKTEIHKIEDEIFIKKSDSNNKLIYLQKIRLADGREELRLGYYVIGKKKGRLGKWVWGQYAAFFPAQDFKRLFTMARKKGWI